MSDSVRRVFLTFFRKGAILYPRRARMDFEACHRLLQERSKLSNTIAPPQPPPATGPLEGLPFATLGQQLLHWQAERVGVYQRFEEGFVRFLQVPEAQGYEALVASTTSSFASISDSVNALCSELARQGAEAIAKVGRSLQDAEREKLTLTAQLQIVRHGMAVDAHKASAAEEAGSEVPDRERRAAQLRSEEVRRAVLSGPSCSPFHHARLARRRSSRRSWRARSSASTTRWTSCAPSWPIWRRSSRTVWVGPLAPTRPGDPRRARPRGWLPHVTVGQR